MRLITVLFFVVCITSCSDKGKEKVKKRLHFSEVSIEPILRDSFSIRALDIYNDTLAGFGYDKGYGFIDIETNKVTLHTFTVTDSIIKQKKNTVEQRAVGFTDASFFSLGIGSPAILRKMDIHNKEQIVYVEKHPKAFYDALAFWNSQEGIAMGDPTGDCLSILITRNGGNTWTKIPCNNLPKTIEGEAAFAASNGNIAIVGDKTWVVSGGMQSRVFYSPDKGNTWQVYNTPMIKGKETTGAYSVDFYDKNNGVIFGGDYTDPSNNAGNIAITNDGGKTWTLVSNDKGPGYKSCVRYIPNSDGKEIVAIGFTGISISNDAGKHWKEVSNESFYTLRFLNDSIAIAAGKGSIAKLVFK